MSSTKRKKDNTEQSKKIKLSISDAEPNILGDTEIKHEWLDEEVKIEDVIESSIHEDTNNALGSNDFENTIVLRKDLFSTINVTNSVMESAPCTTFSVSIMDETPNICNSKLVVSEPNRIIPDTSVTVKKTRPFIISDKIINLESGISHQSKEFSSSELVHSSVTKRNAIVDSTKSVNNSKSIKKPIILKKVNSNKVLPAVLEEKTIPSNFGKDAPQFIKGIKEKFTINTKQLTNFFKDDNSSKNNILQSDGRGKSSENNMNPTKAPSSNNYPLPTNMQNIFLLKKINSQNNLVESKEIVNNPINSNQTYMVPTKNFETLIPVSILRPPLLDKSSQEVITIDSDDDDLMGTVHTTQPPVVIGDFLRNILNKHKANNGEVQVKNVTSSELPVTSNYSYGMHKKQYFSPMNSANTSASTGGSSFPEIRLSSLTRASEVPVQHNMSPSPPSLKNSKKGTSSNAPKKDSAVNTEFALGHYEPSAFNISDDDNAEEENTGELGLNSVEELKQFWEFLLEVTEHNRCMIKKLQMKKRRYLERIRMWEHNISSKLGLKVVEMPAQEVNIQVPTLDGNGLSEMSEAVVEAIEKISEEQEIEENIVSVEENESSEVEHNVIETKKEEVKEE